MFNNNNKLEIYSFNNTSEEEVLSTYTTSIDIVSNLLFKWLYIIKYSGFNLFRYIYVNGPSYRSIGFWQGMDEDDICNFLTNVSSKHWKENSGECSMLIDRKTESFCIGVVMVLLLFFLWYYIHYLMYVKPIHSMMKVALVKKY